MTGHFLKQNQSKSQKVYLTPPVVTSKTTNFTEVESSGIHRLIQLMSQVNTKGREAKLNATTISDGKGGRILL